MISLFVRGNSFGLGFGPLPCPSGISSLSYLINPGREPTPGSAGQGAGAEVVSAANRRAERVRMFEETLFLIWGHS